MKQILTIACIFILGCGGSGGGGGENATVQKIVSINSDFQSRIDTYESNSVYYGFGAVDNLVIEYSQDLGLAYETISGIRGLCVPGSNPKIVIYEFDWTGQMNNGYKDAAFYHFMGHCHAGKSHRTNTNFRGGPSTLMADGWNPWIYPNPGIDGTDINTLINSFWLIAD